MKEDLKRRTEERLADWDGPVTDLIRDLFAECERLSDLVRRVEQPIRDYAGNLPGTWHDSDLSGGATDDEQPKPEPVALPRYGIKWNGPNEPIAIQMDDGYWTPWHLASAPPAIPEPKPEPVAQCEIVRVSPGMHRLDWNDPDWWASLPVGKHTLYTSAPPAIPETNRPDVEAVRSGRAVAISPRALEALRKRAIPSGYALTISQAGTATSENSEWLWLQSPRGDVVRVGENGRNGVGPVIYNFLRAFAAKVQP